jgi:hypothetical protein
MNIWGAQHFNTQSRLTSPVFWPSHGLCARFEARSEYRPFWGFSLCYLDPTHQFRDIVTYRLRPLPLIFFPIHYLHSLRSLAPTDHTTSPPWIMNQHILQKVMSQLFLSSQWRNIRRVDLWLHSFLALALDVGECSTSRRGCFSPGKNPGTHWIGRLGGPQSRSWSFGEEKNLILPPGCEPRTVQSVA